MGGGSWTSSAYDTYTKTTRGMSAADYADAHLSTQEVFKIHKLSDALNPYNIVRACHDSEEHPNTLPVILALDVTGSMGSAARAVNQKLNEIMTKIYENPNMPDVEFCVMGIGDLTYDDAPIQMSQFESDIRIAEQNDQIYFEAGGGGNHYESYTAAWYMGSRHCDLHCWNRGKKGIIITLGDELPNPYLPKGILNKVTGDHLQADVETPELYNEVIEKFNVYHIAVNDSNSSYRYYKEDGIDQKWRKLLGDNYSVETINSLPLRITQIIEENIEENIIHTVDSSFGITLNENNEVTW